MKTTLLSLVILVVTMSFVIDNGSNSGSGGKLNGIVTYKDSYELSAKADAGSEIYAVNLNDLNSTQYADIAMVIDNFQRNKSFFSLSKYNTLDVGRIQKLQENFDKQSGFAANYVKGFMKLPAVAKVSTNKNGNYSLNLRPGKYIILAVSGSVKSNNIVESGGNIGYKVVEIKPASETFTDVNFEKVENMMILLLTAKSPEGC